MGNALRVCGLILVIAVVMAFVDRHRRTAETKPNEPPVASAVDDAALTIEIARDDYGERWPFVRLRAVIECVPTSEGNIPDVVLGTQRYAFTGGTAGLLRIPTMAEAEWLDRGDYGYGKIDLTPVRDDAFRKCNSPPGPLNPTTR